MGAVPLIAVVLLGGLSLVYGSVRVTNETEAMRLVKDIWHLKEHLKEHFGMEEKAAEEYLKENNAQAQFFLMHDYDNNSRLDGLELLHSFSHHEHSAEEHQDTHDHHTGPPAPKQEDDHDFVNFVDVILEDQDLNKDGYISYPEYVTFMNKQLEKMKEENKQRGHD